MLDDQTARTLIETRLDELERRLERIDADLDAPKATALEDQAIDLEDDEVLERMARTAQRETRLLRAALARLDEGSYGICESCGDDISEPRLRAVPYTILCQNCASAAEKRS